MATITISKKEYRELIEKKFRYEYLRQIIEGDIFSSPPTRNIKEVIKSLSSLSESDVTGEMKGKILSLKKAGLSCHIIITNGLKPNNLTHAVMGKKAGTKLSLN